MRLVLVLLAVAAGAWAVVAYYGREGSRAPVRYANPVAPGSFPDPSVLRTGGVYWAVSTSHGWRPAFTVLRSRDLVNWQPSGRVLARTPRWARGVLWAPELVRHGGRFHVYYSALDRRERFCVAVATARRPGGPYRDRGPLACPRLGAIDPLPVRDERGRPYLVWKVDGNFRGRPTPIVAAPLRRDGLRLGGPPRELIRNDRPWEGEAVEGPAIARRGGTFYMLYSAGSCCGHRCDYVTAVARAPRLLGPWRKHPRPILRGDTRFRCPGHGSVLSVPGGGSWFAYHAYPASTSVHVGRALMLDRLVWDAGGWPRIRTGSPSRTARSPLGARQAPAPAPFTDAFAGRDLGVGWEWLSSRPPLRVRRGRLLLGPGLVGRQPGGGDYVAEALVTGSRRGAHPALAAATVGRNAVGVQLRGRRAVAFRRLSGRTHAVASRRLPPAGRVRLRLHARGGRRFRVAAIVAGRRFPIGPVLRAPPWRGDQRVALETSGPKGARGEFGRFGLEPLPAGVRPAPRASR